MGLSLVAYSRKTLIDTPFCICESRGSEKIIGLSSMFHSHRVDVSHLLAHFYLSHCC